mmetsp:Transcript_61148/g.158712  ORF Transcript_61148/g.158712 Transcript_61148/m.158712 type:complete len:215 (-) Transcript_61148:116-760(-)
MAPGSRGPFRGGEAIREGEGRETLGMTRSLAPVPTRATTSSSRGASGLNLRPSKHFTSSLNSRSAWSAFSWYCRSSSSRSFTLLSASSNSLNSRSAWSTWYCMSSAARPFMVHSASVPSPSSFISLKPITSATSVGIVTSRASSRTSTCWYCRSCVARPCMVLTASVPSNTISVNHARNSSTTTTSTARGTAGKDGRPGGAWCFAQFPLASFSA